MGGEKTTIMVLKVDLDCSSCYKKVKKILCKFPQIRDQVYDEKGNRVTITVVCCNPEKIRDKLCCKGCGVIKSIEIKEPPKPAPEKPKEPEKPKQPEKPTIIEKPKEPEKPKQPVVIEKPKEPEKPKVPEKPKEPEKPKVPEKPKEPEKPKPKEPEKPKETPKPAPPQPPAPEPVQEYPAPPHGYCCGQCSAGQTGGPCYNWYGRPVPPPPCYGGQTGGPCYEWYGRPVPPPPCYGYGTGCNVSRCDQYFSDENASSCSIM